MDDDIPMHLIHSARFFFSFFLLLLLHVVYERRVGTRTSLQDCNTRAVSLLVWLKFAWMSIFWTGPAVVGSQGLCGACSNCGFVQTVSTEQVELHRSWLEFQLELSVPFSCCCCCCCFAYLPHTAQLNSLLLQQQLELATQSGVFHRGRPSNPLDFPEL